MRGYFFHGLYANVILRRSFATMKAYPAKIILAWAEAIGGNQVIRDWLTANGFPELGLFVFALHHKEDARQWLMENGHPELMALINGAEGMPNARLWLRKNGYDVLEKMALSADNDEDAFNWLMANGFQDMAMVSYRIRSVKNEIERRNNDIHTISSE